MNIPVIKPVTLPGLSFSKYDNAPVPPEAVTVILPSDDPLQLRSLPWKLLVTAAVAATTTG